MDMTDWSAWDGALEGVARAAANDNEAGFGRARVMLRVVAPG
ncbi:hypothetical protein [Sphingomonas sp. IC-56]|nr:hypothetical protein [Sphingomonas sp. IC-56]